MTPLARNLSILLLLCVLPLSLAFDNSTFSFQNQRFNLNGKVFKIVAGEIHYSRIPFEYWRHRIQMVRALGCNALSVYIMWNHHEISPGKFDFATENQNLALFLTIAKEENMYVLIRPGPYVCAEWDFGGHPWWLLKDPKMELRSQYEGYVTNYQRYIKKVAEVIEPFQINYGGPIIMLQIENEYGYWGKDNSFPISLLNSWVQTGKIVVPYYTADPASGIKIGGIEGLAAGINPGVTQSAWSTAQNAFPNGPWLSAETYPGWLTHWGEKWATKSILNCEDEFNYLCEDGSGSKSFSIYMAHGGTNFGFTAGANFDLSGSGTYQPDITSYDYDAPINEQGAQTTKFTYIRNILSNCLSRKISAIPDPIPTMKVAEFKPSLWASIWENLPTPIMSDHVITMENLDQGHGFVLYSANVATGTGKDRNLFVQDVHDFANVYANGNYIGSLDRRVDQYNMNVSTTTTHIDILVEAMGHINFSKEMNLDRKGITDHVYLDDKEITGWTIYSLPFTDDYVYNLRSIFDPKQIKEGLFFRAVITLTETQDTYLDMSRWSKGFVWVNGRNLGRYWSVGPQFRLYCPGVWLLNGVNEIVVFDMHRVTPDFISGFETLQ